MSVHGTDHESERGLTRLTLCPCRTLVLVLVFAVRPSLFAKGPHARTKIHARLSTDLVSGAL